MSPAERGENFQDETTVFPSFDEVTGTGYQLHPPPYTKEEQIALLAGRTHGATIWEALHLYCNGCRDRVGELFTISQDEYLQWAREESLEHFINMGSPQTDFHFLTKSDRGWELRFQERSGSDLCQEFKTLDAAKEYVIKNLSLYGVFYSLAESEQAQKVNMPPKNSIPICRRLLAWIFRK